MGTCDFERAYQTLIQREIQRRIAQVQGTLERRLRQWADGKKGQGFAVSFAQGVGDIARGEVGRLAGEALAPVLAGLMPPPQPLTGEQRDAILVNYFNQLVNAGVNPLAAEKATAQEYCVLEVLDGLRTGQLIETALGDMA